MTLWGRRTTPWVDCVLAAFPDAPDACSNLIFTIPGDWIDVVHQCFQVASNDNVTITNLLNADNLHMIRQMNGSAMAGAGNAMLGAQLMVRPLVPPALGFSVRLEASCFQSLAGSVDKLTQLSSWHSHQLGWWGRVCTYWVFASVWLCQVISTSPIASCS